MPPVSLHFFGHQAHPLRSASVFDIGTGQPAIDAARSAALTTTQAAGCYRPGLDLLLDLVQQSGGRFRVALTLTGPWLDQVTAYAPDLLDRLGALAATGAVSWVAVPDHHGLSFVTDRGWFAEEMGRQEARLEALTGSRPRLCMQPGYLYTNPLAYVLQQRGYAGCLVAGGASFLRGHSPHWVHHASHLPGFRLLVRDAGHSDDLSLRFGADARTYSEALAALPGEVINLYLDLDWLGSHSHRAFLAAWVSDWLARQAQGFVRPEEALAGAGPGAALDAPGYVTGLGPAYDLSPWLGNDLQAGFQAQLLELAPAVTGRSDLHAAWRALTDAAHLLRLAAPEGGAEAAYSHLMGLFADFQLQV